ncbi:hypothetical protein [Lactococcus lactis]|uniref:hypothetical protein n=1 Tax=Lactococcus lactis TaxID=1358 RepID=UPI0005188BEF|nr:hypothetical protein [Lactococcus lactis]
MKLSEIEEVGYLLTAYDEEDVYEDGDINYDVYEFHRDNYTQNDLNKCGLTQWDFCDCQAIYTADQMQEFAKECVREAIILNSGGAVSDDMIKRAIDSVFTEDTKND